MGQSLTPWLLQVLLEALFVQAHGASIKKQTQVPHATVRISQTAMRAYANEQAQRHARTQTDAP